MMCKHRPWLHSFLLFFAIIARIKSALVCPYPDHTMCGNDGRTYRNKCEWNFAAALNPGLELRQLGPCKEPYDELDITPPNVHRNNNFLRARNKRKRNMKLSIDGTIGLYHPTNCAFYFFSDSCKFGYGK
ncbi:uncharacterized protein [Epargyreus clarus]|uniref:uncharacterized protein n=1 Tax=Epargyreus clarus TaxID=520877 RepID=UPI003C2BCAC6